MFGQVRLLSVAALVAFAALSGCKKDAPAAEPSAPKAAAPAKGSHFTVALTASPTRAQEPIALQLSLKAADGFHVNADYPAHFKPDAVEGVAFEHARYDLKDVATKIPCQANAEDACELSAQVPARAEQPGKKKISGTFAFSVCNPEQCLIEKQPVSVEVDVLAAH
jgi:hypothetical protein